MFLTYKSEKLRRLCECVSSNKDLVKNYGIEVAKRLPQRIIELKSFNCLNDILTNPPLRRHKLEGKLSGLFAINITSQYRLIFRPIEYDVIVDNLKEIKNIEIMEVSKHYE